MPKIQYIDRDFKPTTLATIEKANRIIGEYSAAGFRLTLRQLYYQFVARSLISNTHKSYNRLGAIINDGRLAGLIDWDAIEDRGRKLQTIPSWDSPHSIIRACAEQFQLDPWERQDHAPEVWVEKEALLSVVARPCRELRVAYFACKGYTSQSEMWRAGNQRMANAVLAGKVPVIFHLGDHDPSGIDMTRDVADRLELFVGRRVEIHRLALNMPQVEEHQPPPNPAKVTDSRFEGYRKLYGDESWELDALEPSMISDLIKHHVRGLIDEDEWSKSMKRERAAVLALEATSRKWDAVTEFLTEEDAEKD